MSIAIVQHTRETANADSVSLTGVTTGNFILLSLAFYNGSLSTSVGDGVNTYTLIRRGNDPDTGAAINELWYAKNVTGGNLTVSITYSAEPSGPQALSMVELSGVDKTSPIGSSQLTNGSADTVVGPVLTAANATDWLFTSITETNNVCMIQAPWTELDSQTVRPFAYYAPGLPDLYQATTNDANDDFVSTGVVLKQASSIDPVLQTTPFLSFE